MPQSEFSLVGIFVTRIAVSRDLRHSVRRQSDLAAVQRPEAFKVALRGELHYTVNAKRYQPPPLANYSVRYHV